MPAIRMIRTFCILFLVGWVPGFSQTPVNPPGTAGTAKLDSPKPQRVPSYVLGPDDQIMVFAFEADELSNKATRIDTNGYISLPMVGRFQAANLTIEQLEAEIQKRLSTYIRDPQVTVSVTDFRSQPVSVVGMVNTPGVQQLQGRKTIVEILSMAGGLRPEAGPVAKITRRLEYGRIPLPGAQDDPTGQFSMAELTLRDVMTEARPEQNILIQPFDVISIPKGDIVYVTGEVKKSGGFVLNDRKSLSIIELLAMAEGLTPVASKKSARILRLVPGSEERTEIALDLGKIYAGKAPNVALYPEDILIVPTSGMKATRDQMKQSAVSMVTSMIIWGILY